MKHCIVTPDIVGPVNNGGIGTHCHWFARLLAETGREVTILFTGAVSRGSEAHWKRYYARWGIEFVWLENAITRRYTVRILDVQRRSLDVYRFLEARAFDVIHFQEWQGNGLQTLQARRTLEAFDRTCITVTMHSNTRWIAEGGQHWYKQPLQNATTSWAEAFMARHADMLFSPSRYMVDWVEARGWILSDDVRVIPVCAENRAGPADAIAPDDGVLAFFGRLETRKGLDIFLRALERLLQHERAKIRHVHFVGRVGTVRRQNADKVIAETMTALGLPFEIHADLGSEEAIALLVEKRANVFVPSLVDNYPLAVVEAAGRGLSVHASRVGAIPEILGEARLFEPTVPGLTARLSSVLQGAVPAQDFRHDFAATRAAWLAAAAECEARAGTSTTAISGKGAQETPLVSICVPYYNYADYLPKLLDSLRGLTYRNFEVIIFDDGSPDPRARAVFDRLAASTTDLICCFERHANAGVGATRNAAARLARGDYLVFMDSDNLAKPDMLDSFLTAMHRTEADVVTCYFDAFEEHLTPGGETHIHHVYAPIGPVIEAGWSENVFGDANFCIRRSVFEALGGFGTERDSSWEDWEFLARLCLRGFHLEVLPKSLFWYRYTEEGFSRNTDRFKNERRVLRPYLDAAGPDMAAVVETMRQVALDGNPRGAATPAGAIAGAIADRIYRKLGSPTGKRALVIEKFFKRFIR